MCQSQLDHWHGLGLTITPYTARKEDTLSSLWPRLWWKVRRLWKRKAPAKTQDHSTCDLNGRSAWCLHVIYMYALALEYVQLHVMEYPSAFRLTSSQTLLHFTFAKRGVGHQLWRLLKWMAQGLDHVQRVCITQRRVATPIVLKWPCNVHNARQSNWMRTALGSVRQRDFCSLSRPQSDPFYITYSRQL
jgi:hypothetical protein